MGFKHFFSRKKSREIAKDRLKILLISDRVNCSPEMMEMIKTDIAKDTAFQEALKLNIKYWLYNLVKTNAMNGITNTSVMESVTPWWQMAFYGVDAFLALLTLLFIVLYAKKLKKA